MGELQQMQLIEFMEWLGGWGEILYTLLVFCVFFVTFFVF